MTKPTPESDLPAAENQDADLELDDKQGDKQPSGSGGTSENDLKELASSVKRLEAMVQSFQSDKDKGVKSAMDAASAAQQQAENLKGQIERVLALAKEGKDVTSIAQELGKVSLEDRMTGIETKLDQLLGLGSLGTVNSLTAMQRKVIEEVGLKEDDQAVTDAFAKGLTGDALRAELAMAALKQAKKPSPGPSSHQPLDKGSGEQQEDYDVTDIEDSDKLYKMAAEKEFGQ
jgi:outer membrane murein-binding lipoprotein Lpp